MEWIWGPILTTPFRRTCGSPGSLVAAGNCIGQAVSCLTRLSSSLIFSLLRLSLSPTCWFVCSLFLGNVSDGSDCAIHQCLWTPSFYHLYPASFSLRFIPLYFHHADSCVVFPRSWARGLDHFISKNAFLVGNARSFCFQTAYINTDKDRRLSLCLSSLMHMKG